MTTNGEGEIVVATHRPLSSLDQHKYRSPCIAWSSVKLNKITILTI